MTEDGIVKGWKDIAKFLNTSERSAVRWMKELGLPVQRVGTRRGASVFAHEKDLLEWLHTVGTQLVERGEREVDEAMAGPVSNAERESPHAPRLRTRIFRIAGWAAVGFGAIALLAAATQRRPSPSPGLVAAEPPLRVERTATLRVVVPGFAAATLVLTDGTRSTLAVPGRPPLDLRAKLAESRLELEVLGVDAAGSNVVLLSTVMAPGTRVGVKRPYRFDIEWPPSHTSSTDTTSR
jgi:hypothetical protein